MKHFELLKSRWFRLAAFSLFCLVAPYIAPLVQRGDSTIYGTLWAKISFAFAAASAVVLCALLIRKKAVRIPVVAAVFAALELLVLFEVFMFCFTGHSFDQSFLLHFNINAVPAEVIRVFWKPVGTVLLVFFSAVAASGYLAGKVENVKFDLRKQAALILALLLFFLPETPGVILTGVIAENAGAAASRHPMDELGKIHAEPGKNLVFIVVESLEQNYLSEEHFPGLIPNIVKWMNSPNALVFENMLSASTNTFDFLYQSHIGDYIYSITDSDYADRRVSLSQILKTAGYNTSFLKACSLDFASTGTFVEKVKYDRRMDWQNPEVKKQVSELGEWGFRDYELFEVARGEFNKLAAQGKPFIFTLFTVDSHAPTGVIGKHSLSYTLPDGEKRSLLSALHTTDAALGKFLEFIANSPVGKDTMVVISGDHLVMRDVVPGGKSVQAMLGYKKRENILTFILNGKDHGKFMETCWPVDLAPMILSQMGVNHNAVFPRGVNAMEEKTAAPRKKLSYKEYMALQNPNAGNKKTTSGILSRAVRVTGNKENATLHFGSLQVKCDPLQRYVGTFMEFHSGTDSPTSWKNYLNRRQVEVFRTNPKDRALFYMLCSCRENIYHFILGERELGKCFLAAIVGGWYKIDYAGKLHNLTLSKLDEPLPEFAEAKIDISKNIVTLKKGGWTFPLFSKTDTYLPQCAVLAFEDDNGRETVIRADTPWKTDRICALLANGSARTLIAPPGSPFQRQFGVPKKQWDQLMRVRFALLGEKLELIPMRLPGEDYIEKTGKGQYVLRREGEADAVCRLVGGAPGADFADGRCYAATFDKTGRKVVSAKSFRGSRAAVDLMLNPGKDGTTLLICGRNSEFLKKYYPHLSTHNVLFAITPAAIRHAVQYDNGNFRIPAAAEPLDVMDSASAQLADNTLIVSWGNVSFVILEDTFNTASASGSELALKLLQYAPANPTLFFVNDRSWLPDILKGYNTDYLILGNDRSSIPELLQQQRKAKFFVGISRGSGWELFWSDRIDFSIDRK